MKEILTLQLKMDDYMNPKLYLWDTENKTTIIIDTDNQDKCAEILGCKPEFLDTLFCFVGEYDDMLKAIKMDMTDLYKEIKALKNKLDS